MLKDNKSIIHNKHELSNTIVNIRRDLAAIRANKFDLAPVTEYSAIECIAFDIKHKERLREIGALNLKGVDEKGNIMWRYGYYRTNENNAAVNNKLYAVDKLLSNILDFITECCITRKIEFSEAEKNMLEIIIGGNQDTQLVASLKGGGDYA